MILTIYNGKSYIVVYWHKLNSTAEKTRPRVTTDQQTWKEEKWKLLQTQDSLWNRDRFVHNNKNGSV